MYFEESRAYGDLRYLAADDAQRDDDLHYPVYKTNVHGTLCAVKIVAYDTEAEANNVKCRLEWANVHFSGIIVPIKTALVHRYLSNNGVALFMLEVIMQWSSPDPSATLSWYGKMFFRITIRCLQTQRYYNDVKVTNVGALGWFDVDDAFGTYGNGEGCYASHSTLILLWMQRYGSPVPIPPEHPLQMSLDTKGAILGHVSPSALTQILIMAECYRTLRRVSFEDEEGDATSLVGLIRQVVGIGGDGETLMQLANLMWTAAQTALVSDILFTTALRIAVNKNKFNE